MQPKDMTSYVLEILFTAAASMGTNAGQIVWESPALKHLQVGHTHWRFSSDSGRATLYWDAIKELEKYGYVRQLDRDGLEERYEVTNAGYAVAEECCHEWWAREFERVRAWRASRTL